MTPPTDIRDRLVARYFAGRAHPCTAAPGEALLREGAPNLRLYLLHRGLVKAYLLGPEGEPEELYSVREHEFIGVTSFFSRDFRSRYTVVAVTACELSYLDRDEVDAAFPPDGCLDADFMPLVVQELHARQMEMRALHRDHEALLQRLQSVTHLAALGQLAAGVAHELNNAMAVVGSGAQWLGEALPALLAGHDDLDRAAFAAGRAHGRAPSAEVRRRARELRRALHLGEAAATDLARTGLPPDLLRAAPDLEARAPTLARLWEMGATLHDLALAARQSEHVIFSMRDLGKRSPARDLPVNLEATVHSALALLRGVLRDIAVAVRFPPLPDLRGNPGELVQVWTNLVRNAADALRGAAVPRPAIRISAAVAAGGDQVTVRVSDNGPGVPRELRDQVFAPSFTTRRQGLSFGLGLGLPIVRRIVGDYGGAVVIEDVPVGACFAVTLPLPAPAPESAAAPAPEATETAPAAAAAPAPRTAP